MLTLCLLDKNSNNIPSLLLTWHSLPQLLNHVLSKTAIRDPSWFQAMQDEISTLHDNHTWVLVPRPSHCNVVGSKWVYSTKYKEDGSIDRLKAQLVTRGYTQVEDEDFDETFSPVIHHTTNKVILSIVITINWLIRQLNVKNAFLHGTLKELVYME